MDDIILEHSYDFPINAVWEALTDPAALAEWLMPGDFKPVVGHKVTFHCEPIPGFDGIVEVEVLEADRPRRLSYTWKTNGMDRPTTVTFILTPTSSGGTHLRLEHRGFEGDNGKIMFDIFKDGWGHKLASQLGPAISRFITREA
jgi:uncharacterized protein YndB with AHSA1/START domain